MTAAAALSLLALAGFGTVIVFEIPHTADDAMYHAEAFSGDPGEVIVWRCPSEDCSSYTVEEMELGIAEGDFEASMKRDLMRQSTVFVPVPVDLIDPDDIFVKKAAQEILSRTEGYSDSARMTAALWFVQSAIRYTSDEDLYGCSEFWATPTETLYLQRGDCEDTSVLLCSILLAMGIPCVLLDYDGHEAVGVLQGDCQTLDDYLFCETATDITERPGAPWFEGDPDIYVPGGQPRINSLLNGGIASYRNLIQRVAGT